MSICITSLLVLAFLFTFFQAFLFNVRFFSFACHRPLPLISPPPPSVILLLVFLSCSTGCFSLAISLFLILLSFHALSLLYSVSPFFSLFVSFKVRSSISFLTLTLCFRSNRPFLFFSFPVHSPPQRFLTLLIVVFPVLLYSFLRLMITGITLFIASSTVELHPHDWSLIINPLTLQASLN